MKKVLKTLITCVCAFIIMAGVQVQAKEDVYPNKVRTHIGTLTFDHGVPTKKTSEKL